MPQLILNATANTVTRLTTCMGIAFRLKDENGNPRVATTEEVRQWFLLQGKNFVTSIEDAEARRAVYVAPLPVELT